MIDAHVLIVDDDLDILETARMFLKNEFNTISIEQDPRQLLKIITSRDIDVILLDMNFRKGVNDGIEGFYWLERILEIDPDAVVILITAYGEVDLAVNAMKKGAVDFVLKPWKNQKLLATILSALAHRKSRLQISKLQEANRSMSGSWAGEGFGSFIGESPQILRVKELVSKVAPTDANVLITGENGTGKEVVARSLHQQSNRNSQPFIKVDIGALPESLFESELFGHVKGAFTDAHENKAGRFEIADKGTLFLDEIGNISLQSQVKLLTAVQNKIVTRVGSNKEITVDVRFLSATNQPLSKMVEAGEFRQDLLYRINTVEIALPPLRDRKGDIEILSYFFLEIYRKKYQKKELTISEKAIRKLDSYSWPGNVRELQHTVERAVILSEGAQINDVDILVERELTDPGSPTTLDENEKIFILKTLEANRWNITRTAQVLGLTRTAMYRRLKKHGIENL